MYNDSRKEIVNAWEDGALAGESYMFWINGNEYFVKQPADTIASNVAVLATSVAFT